MTITKAKYTEDTLNWVSLEFDDGSKGQVSITDGIRRQYTDIFNLFISDGGAVDPQFTDEEVATNNMIEAMGYFTGEIQKHIDDAMKVFNTANGVAFESLANVDSASNRVGYSKQAQCEVFVNWAYVTIWDTMRTWQSTLTTLPTEAEFRDKLATVAYNV